MNHQIVTIDKMLAERYLSMHKHNRPVSEAWVNQLSQRIIRGEWKNNGEAIKFNKSGYLVDGWHRLNAIKKSGIPCECTVIFGVPDDAFNTMDQGKNRCAADILAIDGEQNSTTVAAGAKIVFQIENGLDLQSLVSPIQIQKTLIAHPELRLSAHIADRARKIIQPSISSSMWVLFMNKDKELADTFFERLIDGAGLAKYNPIKTLRDRLIINSASTAKLKRKAILMFVIKAWNAVRQGKDLKVSKIHENEEFPQII